jgi:hypothetical protein
MSSLARELGPLGFLSLAVVLLTSFATLSSAGLWEPPELGTAELARRVAHGLFGASGFGDEPLPTRGEVGRGELPVLAIALGFRVFGLSPWAGRLPLALFGLAGVCALFFLVSRLSTRRAAWLSVLALSTMPLYFLQARTLLGDGVTLASALFAWAGLGVAVFDARSRPVRIAALGLGATGLLCGFYCRGLLIGVAAPALAVGFTWLALALNGASGDRLGTLVGAASLCVGLSAALFGAWAVLVTPADRYSIWIGATTGGAYPVPTFDVMVRELGHALFPWSAVIPPALGRALNPPRLPEQDQIGERDRALRLLALSGASLTLIVQTALSTELGLLPYAAPGALAVLCALSLLDLERGARASRTFGLAVGALGVLLVLDFRNFPEKGLVAFSVEGAVFPYSFASPGFRIILLAGAFVVAFFLLVQERAQRARLGVFRAADYAGWPRILYQLWAGNLWFGWLVVVCALMGFDFILLLSDRYLHYLPLEALGEMPRLLVRGGWTLGLALVLSPLLVALGRDSTRLLLRPFSALACLLRRPSLASIRFTPSRGASALVVVALAGATLGFGYYPALMQQISPKRSFEAFRRFAALGEPLGLLGGDAAAARYQAGASARALADVDQALDWLLGSHERRFVALRSGDLPSLNAGYRARSEPRKNLPVLDAGSSEILLAVSRLRPSETNQNPLEDSVLARAPSPQHPLDVDLAGKLQVLGWEVTDENDARVDAIFPGTRYLFTIYYRVNARLSGNWETFVHIDGFHRRYNADHPTLGGRYPFSLWLPGDFIADRGVLRLEPNFTPGSYRVLFGLYMGERRLEVRSGEHEDNRIVAGTLLVR